MIGTIGQLLILTAFVACGIAGFAYFRAAQVDPINTDWARIARASWSVMTVAVIIAFAFLIYLNVTHQFQYYYVYKYTSRDLPLHFLVSASWAGQEGSFLLWIVFNGLVGIALMKWASRSYEAPVMTTVALCQAFLISMIIGLKIGALPIGASPFSLLIEKYPNAPMLQVPGFVPADGEGLNDLLQNYWMAIHPPTLFSGFASMVVMFSFAVAALWKRKYTEWVRPVLPWALFAVLTLGVGIMLGGYWAYETLSFGGYWAWDPVENSSLVPWLIGIAAIHTMIVQKKSGSSHKAALFLSILAYMLVVYSTFLTRSGILGDVSVHSFVDLGLYNQLLLWILTMGLLGFGLFAYRFKELPIPQKEPNMLSREFLIFSGAMLICATAAVILLGTSTPIFGKLFRDNPSTVPLSFYNKWTLPLSIAFVFLAGLGQLFWWSKMSIENINKVLLKPIALAVVSTVMVLWLTPFAERTVTPVIAESAPQALEAGLAFGTFWNTYGMGLLLLLLVFVSFFALYGNGLVLWRIARGNPKLAGGAFTHIGFAIMILGIIASSGFSQPLAQGSSASLGAANRDNFVLMRGETQTVNGYQVTYADQTPNSRGRTQYVLHMTTPDGVEFTVKPVVYKSNKDQWIQHPDLKKFFSKDIFVAVSPNAMFEQGTGSTNEVALKRTETVSLDNNQYTLRFIDFDRDVDPAFVSDSTLIAVAAELQLTQHSTGEMRTLRPIYQIMNDNTVRFVQADIPEWQVSIRFSGMDVNDESITLQIQGAEVAAEDWVVVQAYVKPLINLLWIGVILLSIGFVIAMYRRISDLSFNLRRQRLE